VLAKPFLFGVQMVQMSLTTTTHCPIMDAVSNPPLNAGADVRKQNSGRERKDRDFYAAIGVCPLVNPYLTREEKQNARHNEQPEHDLPRNSLGEPIKR
jgi:hypothetical protein